MNETTQAIDETAPGSGDQDAPEAQGRRRRWLLAALVALVVIIGAGVALFGGNGGELSAEAEPAPALTVTTAAPRPVDWPVTVTALGAIAPWQEASIGTQIGSYQLIDVRVNVGDRVRKGQVLARLDPALLRAEEAQLLASFEQAEANRTRALGLQGSGAMSDQDVLQFVTQARTAAAALNGKRLELRYTNVLAPDDGTISARTATLGAVVPSGEELFRLIRQNRLEWRGELTAAQLAQVGIGQSITLALPDGSEATAIIRQTAPSLDSQSRLALVYADIRPGSRARAGMYASGHIVLGQSPALVVPARSVVIRDGRSHVLKLAGNGATPKVSLQAVATGRRNGAEVEIVQGLGEHERVVVEGAGFLNDGDVVRVASPGRRDGAARP